MSTRMYRLHPACRVRQEKFGLLFYDSRGPKLLFAETGSMLPEDFFSDSESQKRVWNTFSELTRQRLLKLFTRLITGGFIHEQ
ncbi:MAG: mycofactocin biosynthesis chaperone MftB [Desulforhopalus sp.]